MAYAMEAKIYVLPGSHPCAAVLAVAQLKGIPFKKINLIPAQHKIQLKLTVGSTTVPAMKYEGERYHDSLEIMLALESIQPAPPVLPVEPQLREQAMEAARWSDGDFQDMGRRLLWAHIVRRPSAMMSFAQGEKLPVPMSVSKPLLKPVALVASRYNKASDQNVRDDLAKLPGVLDRVDELIAEGTIGGAQPNVADFLIGATLALWMTLDDLRPFIADRPGGQLASRLFPHYKGHVESGILPAEWFDPLRQAEPAGASA
jgi:glutathione S-transferase